MIEQALYFAIGFLAAALAAIAAAPLVSHRAMRLAVARARLRAPVTEKQAIAEMDALRAEHAVEQARVERRLALTEEASISLRAALGRQAAEILRLGSKLAERDSELYDARAEVEKLRLHCRDLEATIGATQIALHDAFVQRDRASAARNAAEARVGELEADSSRDRARLAILAARAEYLEGRMEEIAGATKAAQGRAATAAALETERARIAALEGRLAFAAGENRNLTEQAARSEAARCALAAEVSELEKRLRLSERTREETLLANGRQLAELADKAADLAAARARSAELEVRLASLAAEHHAGENASSPPETLIAAHATMEESLRAARGERDALQRENESLRAQIAGRVDAPAADAELRESIGRLGREVLRLLSVQEPSDRNDSSRAAGGALSVGREPEAALASADGETRILADGGRRRARRSRAPRQ